MRLSAEKEEALSDDEDVSAIFDRKKENCVKIRDQILLNLLKTRNHISFKSCTAGCPPPPSSTAWWLFPPNVLRTRKVVAAVAELSLRQGSKIQS